MSVLRLAATAAAALSLVGFSIASAGDPVTPEQVREICKADFEKACPGAQPGHGALKQCARWHFRSFTPPCQKALKALRGKLEQEGASTGASTATP